MYQKDKIFNIYTAVTGTLSVKLVSACLWHVITMTFFSGQGWILLRSIYEGSHLEHDLKEGYSIQCSKVTTSLVVPFIFKSFIVCSRDY